MHKEINQGEETKGEGEKPDEADNQTAVVQRRRRGAQASLTDCFEDFKQTETLDEDNKWYCNKC